MCRVIYLIMVVVLFSVVSACNESSKSDGGPLPPVDGGSAD